MADGLRREAGRRDSAVMYPGARWLLTCWCRAADLHAAPGQGPAAKERPEPLRPPIGGSRKGSGPTGLPMCPNGYQHHERALMKDPSANSAGTA